MKTKAWIVRCTRESCKGKGYCAKVNRSYQKVRDGVIECYDVIRHADGTKERPVFGRVDAKTNEILELKVL